ncbi:putative protein kinase activity [Lyophyllum shimeji]|uniref:DJ-1/PfpI domain-containing protein n=1 Tax=Lyophyllum shimeji TaxID=47721 RepID=A0A9P3PRS5_LYOSH|nr:putative protein kinase activity [Lyophyllum shimeji]
MSAFEKELKVIFENIQISQEGRPKGPVPVNFGIVVFPGFQALDAFGPLDALHVLSSLFPMKLSVLAATLDPVPTNLPDIPSPIGSNFGQSINPTHTFDTAPPLEVLLIPGGIGAIAPGEAAIDFVAKVYPSLKYLVTICNGASIAARAGVLDGRKATTNKMGWETEVAKGPQVKWVAHARWVVDGNIWTSSGVSAGLDAIFAFMAAVYGQEAAEKVANVMEYERHQDPSRDPFAKLYNLPYEA